MLSDLTEDQRRAITHERGPLLVLAGAGSGKTNVLSRRLAWLVGERGVSPAEITALTYTRAAAEELRGRAETLIGDVHETLRVGTFHSFAGELLRGLGEDDAVEQVAEEERRIMMLDHLAELRLISHDLRGTAANRVVAEFIRLIDRCRDELIDAEEYLRWAEAAKADARNQRERLAALKQVEFATAFVAHDRWLKERGQADFGQAIQLALDRLRGDEQARQRAAERARHIVVDEFQDVNFALSEVLHLLGAAADSFVVVGDDDQAIYRFRGASTQNLEHFREHFPEHAEIRLLENFRSHQAVLDASAAVVEPIDNRAEKRLVSASTQPGPPPRFWVAPSPTAQAVAVVDEIARLAADEDVLLHEQAIVMRAVRSESGPVLDALDAAGIAYQVRGGTGLFERREARQALAWLRLLADPYDAQAHLRVATDPDLGLPYAEVVDSVAAGSGPYSGAIVALARESGRDDAAELIEELLGVVATESPRSALLAVLDRTGLRPRAAALGGAEGSARLQGLAQLERLARERLERDPDLTFAGLVEMLDALAAQGVRWTGGADRREGVQVTTIHSAKGLEFDAVFFIGLTQRNLPGFERNKLEIPDALLKEAVPSGETAHEAEMRRLAYVAMTRARTHLYLVRPSENDRGWSERPSVFFREARAALDAKEESVGSVPAPPLEVIEDAKRAFERACEVAVSVKGEARPAKRADAVEAATRLIDLRVGASDEPPAPERRTSQPPPPSIAITPTALTDYIGCPLRYRFGRVDRVPAPDDAQSKIGTAVHDALEEHYGTDPGGDGQRLLERIETHLEHAGVASSAAGQHALDRARHVILGYHSEHGEPAEVIDTELAVTMPLGAHRLRMRIDRVDAIGERAVRIVDYKTAKRPEGRLFPDQTLPLTLYAVALGRQRGGEVHAAFHYVLDRNPVVNIVVDGPEVDDQLQNAEAAADGIAAEVFEPKPGWQCNHCDFQLICPAAER